MDWTTIISELGGGLSAIVIVGLSYWISIRERRIDDLTDKFIEQNAENIAAMNNLSSAIRERRNAE